MRGSRNDFPGGKSVWLLVWNNLQQGQGGRKTGAWTPSGIISFQPHICFPSDVTGRDFCLHQGQTWPNLVPRYLLCQLRHCLWMLWRACWEIIEMLKLSGTKEGKHPWGPGRGRALRLATKSAPHGRRGARLDVFKTGCICS